MVDLEKESKKLDVLIKKDFFGNISISISWIIYFGGALTISRFSNPVLFFIIWIIVILTLFTITYFLKKRIGDRELLAYSLYKISEGIKNKNLDEKYLLFLNKKWRADKKEVILKKEFVFEDALLKQAKFDENILKILKKLNYAKNNDSLSDFNPEDFSTLARDILYKNRGIIELSGKINKKGLQGEILPTNFKKMFASTICKFLFTFLFLILVFLLCYKFILQDKSAVFISFWATVIGAGYLIFKKR